MKMRLSHMSKAEKEILENNNQKKVIHSLNHIFKKRVAVDLVFLKKFFKLVKIAFRKVVGRELISLLILSVLLVVRTFLSIHITEINGNVVKSIIGANFPDFLKHVLQKY